ncbi:Vesicle-mediated ER to Golgi transport protein, partial [Spiromyces aspiralis]
MNFLTSRLGAFVSPAQQQQQQQRKGGRTPEETIQYLADQVETATLLEDKRAGIQTLKGLCHQYRELVIRIALDPMLKVFVENGPDHPRIAEYVLDSLYYLCSDEEGEDRQRRENSVASELKSAITRIISDERVVATIYEMLANEEQHSVQFAAINLLALLCGVVPDRIQATVLEQPMHVDRLVDLLSSSQDFIRSKSLEVLITMTRLDKTIQQIVVFKNIFERIFGMIAEQGGVRGNIVVEDCLTLTKNLLADNISNQNLFREMSWIRKLRELVDIDSAMNNANATEDDEYYEWDEQTNRNVCMALEIVRVLLEPGISSTQDNQNEMQRCGLIQPLLQISLEAEIPSLIRAQALLALAGLISGNKRIQDIFQRTLVTATPIDEDGHEPLPGHGKKLIPEPAIVIIIRLA